MNMIYLSVFALMILCCIKCCDSSARIDKYKSKRATILKREELQVLGGNTELSEKEEIVNDCLMRHKFQELDYAFYNPQYFNFSHHYFIYKDKIKDSKVYRIIKDMPKGAALHIHDKAVLGPDYLVNITYSDHLYVCFKEKGIDFLFSDRIPKNPCSSAWQLMKNARNSSGNTKKFDAELRKHFTMVVDNPDKVYPTIKEVWYKMNDYFKTVSYLVTYPPISEQYLYDTLKAFRDDNIMYVELRCNLIYYYALNGTEYDAVTSAQAFRNTINRFVKDHPDFVGAKIIFAPSRYSNVEQINTYLDLAEKIKNVLPDLLAGFDLVGPEDGGNPLIEFVPLLEGRHLNYFLHAGETDWYGTRTDDNLVDAILLGAKRLGHAYAISKHPILREEVRRRDIGLEVNVISNVVLSLVRDVRNHPLATFLAEGLPVILSSDDPGAWEADPISYDFYVAFVGVASKLSDLRLLKTLALNSLKYSALSESEKLKATNKFTLRWNEFVDSFDCLKY